MVRQASAGPLFWLSMLSAMPLFLVSAHFSFIPPCDFIESHHRNLLRVSSIDLAKA